MPPRPISLIQKFGAQLEDNVELEFNRYTSSWERMTVRQVWDSLTRCNITINNVPSNTLWGENQSKYHVVNPSGFVQKFGQFNQSTTFQIDLEAPSKHSLKIFSEGVCKVFTINPPVEIHLVQSKRPNTPPSIKIKSSDDFRGKISFGLEGFLLGSKRWLMIDSHRKEFFKQLPREWFESLTQITEVPLIFTEYRCATLSNDFNPSHILNIAPPLLSYFKPRLISSRVEVIPDEGYILEIEMKHLSPNISPQNARFIMPSGEETPVVFTGNTGQIEFTSYNQIQEISDAIVGRLIIEPYHQADDLGIEINQELNDKVNLVTNSGLLRNNTVGKCLTITSTGTWNGEVKFIIQDQKAREEMNNTDVEHTIQIESGSHNFTPSDIRTYLPAIDNWFFNHLGDNLAIEVNCTPFSNPDLFPVKSTSFTLQRERVLVQPPPQEVIQCLERGDPVNWKVDYISEYYPDGRSFKLVHCGREILPQQIDGMLSFHIPQPSFRQFTTDSDWVLYYKKENLLEGRCSIAEIELYNDEEELSLIYIQEENQPIVRASTPLQIITNNQSEVNCKLKILNQNNDVLDESTISLDDGKIAKHIDEWIINKHTSQDDDFDLNSSTQWHLVVTIPSRSEQHLIKTEIKINDQNNVSDEELKRLALVFLDGWDGDPEKIRAISWKRKYIQVCLLFWSFCPKDLMEKHFQQRKYYTKIGEIIATSEVWNKFYQFMERNRWKSTHDAQDGLEKFWMAFRKHQGKNGWPDGQQLSIADPNQESEPNPEPESEVEPDDAFNEASAGTRDGRPPKTPEPTSEPEPEPEPELKSEFAKLDGEKKKIFDEIKNWRKRLCLEKGQEKVLSNKAQKNLMKKCRQWAKKRKTKYPDLPWDSIRV